MFKLLSIVSEVSESITSLSSDRKNLITESKKSDIRTADTSICSVINAKKELDEQIFKLQRKIKKLKGKNGKGLRNVEKLKKKQEDMDQIRAEFESFKIEKENLKNKENLEIEIKKKMVQLAKSALRTGLAVNKENLAKRNFEAKLKIAKERKENEEFIRRRESYYLKLANEKNRGERNKEKVQGRDRSANREEVDLQFQQNILIEMKNQQKLLNHLQKQLKEEETLANHLKAIKPLQIIKPFTSPSQPLRSKSLKTA